MAPFNLEAANELPSNIPEGLYYNDQNPLVHKLVQKLACRRREPTRLKQERLAGQSQATQELESPF
jgi:hypothetical protein